ncbi:MAG: hypothetical protein D6713_03500 [Deltaproteobacteria bacterium]|nr:MAG: hypothetical protein D6713_03500 [Deltaproteobacteria bacterium]
MKRLVLSLTLLVFSFMPTAALSSPGEDIPLSLVIASGHQEVLPSTGVRRIAVGNGQVVKASLTDGGKSLLLTGLSPGTTDIVLWRNGRIDKVFVRVTAAPEREVELERERISAFLRSMGVEKISLTRSGETLIVSGEAERETIETVKKAFPGEDKILWALREKGESGREIFYRLRFIEVSRGELKNFGFSWPSSESISSTLVADGKTQVVSEASFSLLIKNLESSGKARILAEPSLVCEEGSEAHFHAGGEIPVVIITEDKRSVIWKNYGILLSLSPLRKGDEAVTTSVKAEVSTLDHSTGTGDIPGIITRKVTTVFSTSFGKTIILSGLVKNETVKDVSRFPLLGDIPILGELFKSRNFRDNHTELVITITPYLLDEKISNETVEKAEEKFEEMGEKLKIRLLD